ncbi:relaxase/mobilization nuclease domain-containing protein [Mesorhizobium sp. GbtcB19]|uniref:relaxase/mobilization nuclease domain-containing protein n=1 Tax=Mesorhizobium sp. GbtcB19 TaxID=2824764 RepID=UPI001C30458D|nr:relaxase/mobilization nuclease domain-containing protein [Mesorhizobium sp. GbtcB19]
MSMQAVVHMVENGGRHTPDELCSQWDYLCRKGDLELKRSRRYGEDVVPYDELPAWARSWLEQTGRYLSGQEDADSEQELTTHLVVPFHPPAPATSEEYKATYKAVAEELARQWASEMFDSGRYGARWDYVTAFHEDRPHPHLHIVVNRESFPDRETRQTTLLRISHGNEHINWDSPRQVLVEVAQRQNKEWERDGDDRAYMIELEASSRAERGIPGRSPTTGQYRQQMRERAAAARNFLDEAENAEFDLAASSGVAGPTGQGARTGKQGGAHPGNGQGGSVGVSTGEGGERRHQRARQGGSTPAGRPEAGPPRQIEVDPNSMEGIQRWRQDRIEAWREDVASALPGTEADNWPAAESSSSVDQRRRREATSHRRERADEERERREASELRRGPDRRRTPGGVAEGIAEADPAAAQDAGSPGGSSPRAIGSVDEQRRREGTSHRRVQADEERERREESELRRGPDRRRTPGGVVEGTAEPDSVFFDDDGPAGVATPRSDAFRDQQRAVQEERERRALLAPMSGRQAADPMEGVVAPDAGNVVPGAGPNQSLDRNRPPMETRGQRIRRQKEERRQRRDRWRGDAASSVHPMETRAQTNARLTAEAENRRSGAPSVHPMELRSSNAPQHPAPPQPGGTSGSGSGGTDNTRPEGGGTSGRSRDRNSRSRH